MISESEFSGISLINHSDSKCIADFLLQPYRVVPTSTMRNMYDTAGSVPYTPTYNYDTRFSYIAPKPYERPKFTSIFDDPVSTCIHFVTE